MLKPDQIDEKGNSLIPCGICGKENFETRYSCPLIKERGWCFNCVFWMERYFQHKHTTIINGEYYGPGRRGDETPSKFRGMGGSRFDIQYDTGEAITTFDLWSGGTVDDRFRPLFPDNAYFMHTGGREGVKMPLDHLRPETPYSDWSVLDRKLTLRYFLFDPEGDKASFYHVIGVDEPDPLKAAEMAREMMPLHGYDSYFIDMDEELGRQLCKVGYLEI